MFESFLYPSHDSYFSATVSLLFCLYNVAAVTVAPVVPSRHLN